MDRLHADIAAHLRHERWRHEPARRTANAPRAYNCRSCGQEYGDGVGQFHIAELLAIGECGHCYRWRINRANGKPIYPQDVKPNRKNLGPPIAARCKFCGRVLGEADNVPGRECVACAPAL